MRDDVEGVTDVLGTILMVGLTVSMMVGLSILVLNFDGPPDRVHADFKVKVSPGGLLWGDGNEEISLRHMGGEIIGTDDTRVVVAVNGSTVCCDAATVNQQGFADGSFSLGDYWNVTMTIPGNATVQVSIINTEANQIIGDSASVASLSAAGTGASSIVYVASGVAITGTLDDFSNAQSGDDVGATATIGETSVPGGTPTTKRDAGSVSSAVGVTGASDARLSNDVHVEFDDTNDKVALTGYTTPSGVVTIQNVKIGFEGNKGGGGGPNGDPQMRLTYSGVPGATPSTSTVTLTSGSDNTFTLDVTGDKGTWATSDIEAMIVSVERLSSDGSARDAEVDHIFVEFTYEEADNTDAEVRFSFTGVPSGIQNQLQIRYMTDIETFSVEVYDGSSWTTRGTLSSGAFSLFTYSMTEAERNSGDPMIRFVDRDTGATAGTLEVDYARVQTI